MEITSLCTILCLSPPASLRVSPDRSQFFRYESVSLSCEEEEEGSFTGWRVRRNTSAEETAECGRVWGTAGGLPCTLNDVFHTDSGVYWCESDSGLRSGAVNITVTEGCVILESPLLPVTEGEPFVLRCLTQDNTTKETKSGFPTDFYKDGSLIRTESTGEMTIPAVSKSDEGLYKCKGLNLGESPERWLAVRASTNPSRLHSLPVFLSLLGFSLFLLTLPSLLWLRKRRGGASLPAEVTYAEVTITETMETNRNREDDPPEPDVTYSSLRPEPPGTSPHGENTTE